MHHRRLAVVPSRIAALSVAPRRDLVGVCAESGSYAGGSIANPELRVRPRGVETQHRPAIIETEYVPTSISRPPVHQLGTRSGERVGGTKEEAPGSNAARGDRASSCRPEASPAKNDRLADGALGACLVGLSGTVLCAAGAAGYYDPRPAGDTSNYWYAAGFELVNSPLTSGIFQLGVLAGGTAFVGASYLWSALAPRKGVPCDELDRS